VVDRDEYRAHSVIIAVERALGSSRTAPPGSRRLGRATCDGVLKEKHIVVVRWRSAFEEGLFLTRFARR
jgi:thioredoxin reductase